jgi:chromosome segregation ATPase
MAARSYIRNRKEVKNLSDSISKTNYIQDQLETLFKSANDRIDRANRKIRNLESRIAKLENP